MTSVCPQGHVSTTDDFCDHCGAPIGIGSAAPPPQPTEVLPAMTALAAGRSVPAEPCPACGAPRLAGDLFCESCGHDFSSQPEAAPEPAPPTALAPRWTAVVTADRERFEQVAPDGISFPDDFSPLTLSLEEEELRIGRGAAGGDPAVSRLHAILSRQEDGSYAVVDQGSTNGTTLNDDPAPIEPGVPVPLADGDRIHIGAWTTVTLNRAAGETDGF